MHFGAIPVALQQEVQRVHQREVLQEIVQARAAGGNLIFGQMLQPDLPAGEIAAENGHRPRHPGVDALAFRARVVDRPRETGDAAQDDEYALGYAKSARRQKHDVLHVEHDADGGHREGKDRVVQDAIVGNCQFHKTSPALRRMVPYASLS